MALQGRGLLAIWNGIAPGHEAEFVAWHVREHMPERVGLPGFLSGRRYTAAEGQPAYFNFYEVDGPAVLRSPAYLARLNDPTPWTRAVVARFTDTARTICRVAATAGRGTGGAAAVLWFDAAPSGDATAAVTGLAAAPGAVAAHLAVADGGSAGDTAERRLRGGPDREWAAVLIADCASVAAARALAAGPAMAAALAVAGLPAPVGQGVYALDYALSRADLGPAEEGEKR